MKDVAGKVAFVTGGASGLGLAMARSFSAAGMKVAIADIEDSALDAVRHEFAETNATVIAMKVDVSDRDAMTEAAQETFRTLGNVHVVCNNAGVAVGGNISDMTYRDWDWVTRVNLDGVVNGVMTFVNHIKGHGEGGHFVNTASMAGQIGIGGMSVYNMTKFAVVGMSESMRADLAPFNIGTSVLCPGFVATQIFSSQRNRPEKFGGVSARSAIVADSSNAASQIAAMMANALDPAIIGDMVLHAITTNEFYILSHPEFKPAVANRSRELDESFDRWAEYRRQHNID